MNENNIEMPEMSEIPEPKINYENIRRRQDGTFVINFDGYNFHITPDYPPAELYGKGYTWAKLNEYAEEHPEEVAAYIAPEPPQPNLESQRQARIAELEIEAQKATCQMLAFMDVDVNQQKLIDIMIEIEDLKGNTE